MKNAGQQYSDCHNRITGGRQDEEDEAVRAYAKILRACPAITQKEGKKELKAEAASILVRQRKWGHYCKACKHTCNYNESQGTPHIAV